MKMLGLNPMEQEIIDLTNNIVRNGFIYFPEFCAVILKKFREDDEDVFNQNMFKVTYLEIWVNWCKLFCFDFSLLFWGIHFTLQLQNFLKNHLLYLNDYMLGIQNIFYRKIVKSRSFRPRDN